MNPVPNISGATPESPWLGLASYTENTSGYFFGRDVELRDLLDRVVHKPLTVLFGQSGWGKTSLLQAGLIPRLRQAEFLPVFIRLAYDDDAQPLETQVINALLRALDESGFSSIRERIASCSGESIGLWQLFHDPELGLVGGKDLKIPCPVLILDQFEEIFTLGDKPERRRQVQDFREALAALIENRPPASVCERIEQNDALAERLDYQTRNSRVLIALRYDFLHLLERWRRQMPSVMDNRMELRLLGGQQAFDAVVRPGQMRPGKPPIISDQVGAAIVRFVAGVKSSTPLAEIDAVPPLLSLVCAELNSQRIALGLDEVSQSQFEGGSSEILGNFYQRSFDSSTYGEKLLSLPRAEDSLRALQVLIEDRLLSADGFRESIAFDTMLWELSDNTDSDAAKKILGFLVDRRLLSVDERGGVQRIELTHDVLTRIARASREARKEKEALERARLDQERTEFEKQKAYTERNRLRKFALAAAAFAIVAIFAAVFGWVGMKSARDAAERSLKQEAEAKHQQAEANAGFSAARDATDKMVARLAGDDFSYVPGIQPFREESARKAIELYKYMASRHPDEESIQIGLLQMEAARANILNQIGTVEEAMTAYELLIPKLRTACGSYKSDDFNLMVANTLIEFDRFRTDAGLGIDRSLLEDALQVTKTLGSSESDLRAGVLLVRVFNALGNNAVGRDEKIKYFSKARNIGLDIINSGKLDVLLYDRLSAATHNLGRQLQYSSSVEDQRKALELMNEADELQKKALAMQPDSPRLLGNAALGLQQQAELQAKLGNIEEAKKLFEQAISRYRATAQANPRVSQYRAWLADGLKNYANFLSARQEFVAAKQCYMEGVSLLEELVTRREARPNFGQWLLSSLNQLSEFEQWGKGAGIEYTNGANPYLAEKTREHGIIIGRKFIEKYPQNLELRYELGRILFVQAINDPVKKDPIKATALLEESMGVMQMALTNSAELIEGYHVTAFMQWTVELDSIFIARVKTEKNTNVLTSLRIRYLDQALNCAALCKDYESKQSLMLVATRRGQLYLNEKQPEKALALHLRMIEFCEPAFREKPYYYYLRDAFSGQLKGMALSYQQLGNREAEIHAWQRWLKEFIIPQFGPFENELLNTALPPTEDNLTRLRTITDRLPKIKMFTVPCQVNGLKVPVSFYIHGGIPQKDADPIADQARWFEEERGVLVPRDVRDSFRKLSNIAHENSVDFADLCEYALTLKDDAKTNEVTSVTSPPKLDESLKDVIDVITKKGLLEKDLTDAARYDLAEAFGGAAFAALFEKKYVDAEKWSQKALNYVAETKPDSDPKLRAGMVFIYGNLAHALLFQGKYEEALKVYRQHWDAPLFGRTFKDYVIEDFAMFDRAGLTHSDMPKLKQALGISGSKAEAQPKN